MTTALQIITRALRANGDYEVGQTVSPEDAAEALEAMNEMLDSWPLQRLLVYQTLEETFNLVAGTASYTIGSTGVFATARPVALENSNFIRNGQLDYSLELINQASYASLPNKSVQTIPQYIYYEPAFPLATIYFDVKPDQAYELHLMSRKTLQSFATLTTDLALPPGYLTAIIYSLAEKIASEYGKEPSNSVMKQAAEARKWIKTLNAPNGVLSTEIGSMNTYRAGNVYRG